MKRPKKRRTAFVPGAIFGTVFAGVVPAIVSCGSSDIDGGRASGDAASKDATGEDVTYYGVGVPCCSVAAAFDAAPDGRDATVEDATGDVNDGG
jgi:hypothetical protein